MKFEALGYSYGKITLGVCELTNSITITLLALAYDKWFVLSNNTFAGYTKPNFDGSFGVDIFRNNVLEGSFNVTELSFLGERYAVMTLADTTESEIEVFDTLTGQKLTDKLYAKKHHRNTAGFVYTNGGMTYATIFTNEQFGRCMILSDDFEIINTEAIMIINQSSSGNLYTYDAILNTKETDWKHIVMHRITGEILQETDSKQNNKNKSNEEGYIY